MPKKRILLVDDEVTLTRLLKRHLERSGNYEVRAENQGIRALEAAREFRPDLILLDVLMPDLTGKEILVQIRADPELNRIPVLFLTAVVPGENTRDEVLGDPALWIAKPVRAADVIEHIERQIG